MGISRWWSTLFVGIALIWVALPQDARAATILLFGDSLVAGYGVENDESLPARLEHHLRAGGKEVTVINGGVSGDTTAGGKTRIDWMLEKHSPDVVMVALGGNDMLRRIRPETTKANLQAILRALQESGTKTILMQVEAPPLQDPLFAGQFNPIYPALAKEFDVPLYPFFLENLFGRREYMLRDGLHPNLAGLDYIATHLSDYLISTGWL